MRLLYKKLIAEILAWLDSDLYYIIPKYKKVFFLYALKYRLVSANRLKVFNKHLTGKTNKNRITISQLEQTNIYKSKDWRN